MSIFDPEAFLDSTVSDSNDTVLIPVPAGEYVAVIKSIKARTWTKSDDPSKGGVALDVVWTIDDSNVAAVTGRPENSVQQSIMLDTTPTGGLDMGKGKNVGLGRLREALGKNEAGQPFSFNQLPGLAARVTVVHEPYKDDIFAKVKGVARL